MSDSPSPLRLSEWGNPDPYPLPEVKSPPLPPPVVAESAPKPRPEARMPEPEEEPADQSPLPLPLAQEEQQTLPPTLFQGFDLLRLPMGILRRWWIPALLGALGLGVAFVAGLLLFSIDSTVSVRLMGRSPQNFATSNNAYVPSRLQGATLLGALASPQVAREVADRFGGDYTPGQLQEMVKIEEVRRTDFVDIVVTTHLPPRQTAELATLWAEEALKFTSHLQSEESAEMRAYLEEQIHRTDTEVERVNQQIVDMRQKSGGMDAERMMESYLASVRDMDLRFETNKIDLQSIDMQLASLRQEIRKHSPSFEELKVEENKLAEMAEFYTDLNPIFIEAKDRVEALRSKVNAEIEAQDVSLSDFTGTYVGNALYLQILELEARRENLLLQQEQLMAMREEARSKLEELPEVAMEASPLFETAQTLRAARDALLGRLKEVTVFQEMAPGYYRMFRAPTEKDVYVSSRSKKLLVAALAGAVLFGMLGVLGAAGLEFLDHRVRTPAEAQAALECSHLAQVQARKSNDEPGIVAAQDIWASTLGSLSRGRVRTFWEPKAPPRAEAFWQALFAAARSMECKVLVVYLADQIPEAMAALPRVGARQLSQPPPHESVVLCEVPLGLSTDQAQDLIERLQIARPFYQEIWIATSGLLREPVAKVIRNFGETIMLCQLDAADRTFWQTQRTLVCAQRPLRGVVTLRP